MIDQIKEANFAYKGMGQTAAIGISKIKNGSKLIIGGELSKIILTIHQHFNWFQKLMWKRCFGIKVEDYNEE